MPPGVGGALSDTAIRPSVCLSHGAAALGYKHAGCLQLSRVLTAGPSAHGRRSATSRTAIGADIYGVPLSNLRNSKFGNNKTYRYVSYFLFLVCCPIKFCMDMRILT